MKNQTAKSDQMSETYRQKLNQTKEKLQKMVEAMNQLKEENEKSLKQYKIKEQANDKIFLDMHWQKKEHEKEITMHQKKLNETES